MATNNSNVGFILAPFTGTIINNVSYYKNISNNNGMGFSNQTNQSTIKNIQYTNNYASFNHNQIGFLSTTANNGTVENLKYKNNTSHDNALSGFRLASNSNGQIDSAIFEKK